MVKRSIRHTAVQLAVVALIFLLVSIFFRDNNYAIADLFLIAAILLTAVNWIIVLRLIVRNAFLDKQAKLFWMALVILIPAVGSIIYVMKENGKLKI